VKPLLCISVLLACSMVARADVSSGPKAGDKVEDFRAFGAVGLFEGKEGSYVAERKGDPTVFVFVQSEHFTRPMARMLKELDTKAKETNEKAMTVAVWLGDPDAAKERLPRI
jgi:hypothetical protein